MKKEYPKMIYKHGEVSTNKENYVVVDNYNHHMLQLEIWGDKRPDNVAKTSKIIKDDKKEDAVNSDKKEAKPKRSSKK